MLVAELPLVAVQRRIHELSKSERNSGISVQRVNGQTVATLAPRGTRKSKTKRQDRGVTAKRNGRNRALWNGVSGAHRHAPPSHPLHVAPSILAYRRLSSGARKRRPVSQRAPSLVFSHQESPRRAADRVRLTSPGAGQLRASGRAPGSDSLQRGPRCSNNSTSLLFLPPSSSPSSRDVMCLT